MRHWVVRIACAGALLLSGCDGLSGGATSKWTISSKTDPLTDNHVKTALANYASPPFNVQVEITCGGENLLEYQFATYDGQDKAAPLDASVSEAGSSAVFAMRLDDAQAQNYVSVGSRYNNAVSIVPQLPSNDFGSALVGLTKAVLAMGAGAKVPDSVDVAKANRLVVKLRLRNGDAVVEIDQSERPIREFLDNCLAAVPAPPSSASPTAADDQTAEINAGDQDENVADQVEDSDAAPEPDSSQSHEIPLQRTENAADEAQPNGQYYSGRNEQ